MDLETLETGLRRAVGRRKVTEDYVAASLVERIAVTLDCDMPTPRICCTGLAQTRQVNGNGSSWPQ